MNRARLLRKKATDPERILWRHLRDRNFAGYRFRRQHPLDCYILDFYCPATKLAIELDVGGPNYRSGQIRDRARSEFLARKGIIVLRFWNHQIRRELDSVLRAIWFALPGAVLAQSLTLILSVCQKGEANCRFELRFHQSRCRLIVPLIKFDIRRSILDVRCSLMIPTVQILGIRFFNGDVDEAIALMSRHGGLLVAPSGTCFTRLREDESYRSAVLSADLAIADSGLMVVMWRLLQQEKVERISGLKYLKHLLGELRSDGIAKILWVLPGEDARQKLLDWSHREAFPINIENCYVAPRYGLEVEDRTLLGVIEQRRPAHVIIAIGSGAQEKLGYYLRENLSYRSAIHCIGGALGFITGDQTAIPDWADRFYLGWFWRLVAQPRTFIPRLSRGLELPWLIWKYREKLPVTRGQ